nr:hypothetical protein [Nonomuraea sp. KC401]
MSYRGSSPSCSWPSATTAPAAAPNGASRPPGFPREKSLRAFDFDANPNVDPAVVNTLATCDWVKKACRSA